MDIAIAWGCTRWNGALWQACSDRKWAAFGALLLLWILLSPLLSVGQSLGAYRRKRQAWRWRCQLLQLLIPSLQLAQQAKIDCPEQRLAEDSQLATEQGHELACTLLRDLLQALFFAGVIVQYPLVVVHWRTPTTAYQHWLIPPCLLTIAIGFAAVANWLAVGKASRLARCKQLQQRLEGRMRRQLQVWTLLPANNTASPKLIDRPKLPHQLDSMIRLTYWQEFQLTVMTNFYQHFSLSLALLLALPSYFAGRVEIGTAMAWMGAFRMVQSSIASLLQHWPMLTTCLTAIERLSGLAPARNMPTN